ncbi:MAG: VWA domain-containing protein [Bryobacteraceae bacterium]|nr:VWA domain-containing protein [Bryobacteraceae bacterium]
MIFALLLAALAVIPALAQQPPRQPPPTPPEEPVIRVEVNLVNLFFSVRDRKGAYVSTLGKDDFTVYEDGKPQEIRFFSRETDQPLTLGLLVDVSRSQEALIELERRASARFLERVLRDKDMAFLISFGVDAELLQDFTNSPVLLAKALDRLRLNAGVSGMSPTGSPVPLPGGPRGTVLYDAVWLASREKLRHEVGRKALIVITDGVDVGSRLKLEQAIEEAQRADAIVYVILFEDPRYTSWQYGGVSGEGAMRRMADETGGRVFRVSRRESLDDIYDTIQTELRSQYSIGYAPTNQARDGSFRRIEVRTKNRDYRVQVRKGYYAPKD